jgi:glycine/D-amino acid oxidase-like deaminating enzyme
MTDHPKSHVTINTPIQFQDDLPEKVDVAIIGAGVVGIFSALYLSRMGKSVIVIEKGRVACEQSSRNWGWIRQQGRDAGELPIMIQANKLWRDVDQQTQGQCGVVNAPINFLSGTGARREEFENWVQVAKEHGVKSNLLSSEEIGRVFGDQSAKKWVTGISTPSDLKGEPWEAVPTVAKLAQENGVLIRENCAVRTLDIKAGQIAGIVTEDGTIACEQVVLAAGAWSSLFARNHGIDIPQMAVRGDVAQTKPLPEFTSQTSLDEELAVRRRQDGGYTLSLCDKHTAYIGPDAFRNLRNYIPAILKGWKHLNLKINAPKDFPDAWQTNRSWGDEDVSPFENCRVLEPKPDPKNIKRMVERFKARFPKIGPPEIAHSWAGMIDTMPDFVPIIDQTPQYSNLIIATGLSGHGFGIGPGFGMAVARMATGKTPEHDLSRFRFSRFSDGSRLELGPSL